MNEKPNNSQFLTKNVKPVIRDVQGKLKNGSRASSDLEDNRKSYILNQRQFIKLLVSSVQVNVTKTNLMTCHVKAPTTFGALVQDYPHLEYIEAL